MSNNGTVEQEQTDEETGLNIKQVIENGSEKIEFSSRDDDVKLQDKIESSDLPPENESELAKLSSALDSVKNNQKYQNDLEEPQEKENNTPSLSIDFGKIESKVGESFNKAVDSEISSEGENNEKEGDINNENAEPEKDVLNAFQGALDKISSGKETETKETDEIKDIIDGAQEKMQIEVKEDSDKDEVVKDILEEAANKVEISADAADESKTEDNLLSEAKDKIASELKGDNNKTEEEESSSKTEEEENNKEDEEEPVEETFQTETKKALGRVDSPTDKRNKEEEVEKEEKGTFTFEKKTKPKNVFSEPSPYSNDELKRAYEDFVKKKELPTFLMRDFVIDYARVYALQATIDEDYSEAEKRDKVTRDLIEAFNNDQGQFDNESKLSNLERRLNFAKQQKQKVQEHWTTAIQQLKTNQKNALEELVKAQEQERIDFENSCQQPDFVQRFTKPSLTLLQLRKMQRSLALAHDFEGAKNAKISADRLQHSETVVAKERAMESVKLKYQELIEKQERVYTCKKQNGDRKIIICEEQMRGELDASDKLIKQLKEKVHEAKTCKTSSLPPLSTGRPAALQANRKIAQYRRANASSRLDVKLHNIGRILNRQNMQQSSLQKKKWKK